MQFLFTTLQHVESHFYGRVGVELTRLGHDVSHVTYSRRAAQRLRGVGVSASCMPDLMAGLGPLDVGEHKSRIEHEYPIPSLRDVYRTDIACRGRSDAWSVERTVRHFVAMERTVEELRPDLVVPEVGNETMRTVAHLVGQRYGATVLFLFYTIFPRPLRLYADTMQAPIVPPEELRELRPEERAEVDRFVEEFTAAGRPIRAFRSRPFTLERVRLVGRHYLVKAMWDRDNPYLEPTRWLVQELAERARRRVARRFYRPLPDRPYVYFPLHVSDDYKIQRLVPHLADQLALVRQLAAYLPEGYELVVKEHPMSLGRNPLGWLRSLAAIPRVRLVDPFESSHEIIRRADAVTVISSTVGLEALLYAKPVLTLGQPFYSGFGLTVDLEPTELREDLPAALEFRPDPEAIKRFLYAAMQRCLPGAPVLVDRSEANAGVLADSLDRVAAGRRARLRPVPDARQQDSLGGLVEARERP